MPSKNSFGAAGELRVGGRTYRIHRLAALEKAGFKLSRIPFSIKILLENLLRFEDNLTVRRSDIEYVAQWDPSAAAREINFRTWPPCATRSNPAAPIPSLPIR